MTNAPPRVVVAGGGVAALEAVLALLERAPTLAVELISAETRFVNRPHSVMQPFTGVSSRAIELTTLADRGVTVVHGRVTAVDPARQVVLIRDGAERSYDALVLALGARPRRAYEHAMTFRGPRDAEALRGLVQDLEAGVHGRVAFVAPPGASWTLPVYELALQMAARARELSLAVELTLITREGRPLEVFGRTASALVECLLEESGIELVCGAAAEIPATGELRLAADGITRRYDQVVALPLLEGAVVPGLPRSRDGFIRVDADGRVPGATHVYAAGDGTDRPIKQGGLAAQQADRVVDALVRDLGLGPGIAEPEPMDLRAMLVTGDEAWYLRRRAGEPDAEVSRRPLWWPPAKLAGRHLAPFLDAEAARESGGSLERRLGAGAGVHRRVALVRDGAGRPTIHRLAHR